MVSNNSLFAGPLLTPTTTLVSASSGTTSNDAPSGTNSINGGPTTGNIFQGQGGDFLNPSGIQNTIDNFGDTIDGGSQIFGSNPNALDILDITNSDFSKILSSDSLPSVSGVPVLNYPTAVPVPDLGQDPSASNILSASTLFQLELGSPAFGSLTGYGQSNPFLWSTGPSASDILGGATTAQNNIIGGNFSYPQGYPDSLVSTGENGTFSSGDLSSAYGNLFNTGDSDLDNMLAESYSMSSETEDELQQAGLVDGSGNPIGGSSATSSLDSLLGGGTDTGYDSSSLDSLLGGSTDTGYDSSSLDSLLGEESPTSDYTDLNSLESGSDYGLGTNDLTSLESGPYDSAQDLSVLDNSGADYGLEDLSGLEGGSTDGTTSADQNQYETQTTLNDMFSNLYSNMMQYFSNAGASAGTSEGLYTTQY